MKHKLLIVFVLITVISCKQKQEVKGEIEDTTVIEKTTKELKEELTLKGFEIFDYVVLLL